MNDIIQEIRDFIRENSNGNPKKFISFLSSLFGDTGSDAPSENFSILKSKAEEGDPEIQCCLGFCYENGIGVPEDKTEAANWYRKAAEQGGAWAQYLLGVCYECGVGVPKDKTEAANWYLKAAEQGYAPAQAYLGLCYSCGEGVPEDKAEAANWYRKAAEQGDSGAQFDIAFCYANGCGVPEDKTEAAKWYRKAADQGDVEAQCNLAFCYLNGAGVPEDKAEAANWYRKAAEQGYAPAQVYLGNCCYCGSGVPEDEVEAVNWFRKAADQGYAFAQWQLGECYANGAGVPEDKAEAVKWLCKAVRQGYEPPFFFDRDLIDSLGDLGSEVKEEVANLYRRKADQGDADAQWRLGECYAKGYGVPEDKEEAAKWLCKAVRQGCEPLFFEIDSLGELGSEVKEEFAKMYRRKADQGDADAQYSLGLCYEEGTGVPKDKTEAINWYRKAAAQGHKEAAEALKRLSE